MGLCKVLKRKKQGSLAQIKEISFALPSLWNCAIKLFEISIKDRFKRKQRGPVRKQEFFGLKSISKPQRERRKK